MKDNKTHGHTSKSYKNRRSAEYAAWNAMICRCHRPNSTGFHNYGGRGISVCQEWRESFESFLNHVGARPSATHTIDRIDNEKDYCPGNVKWATKSEQALNTRRNRLIRINGDLMPVTQAARKFNVPIERFRTRIKSGWEPEVAIKACASRGKKYEAISKTVAKNM